MKKSTLDNLAADQSNPCLTISLNTHRTHPDNQQDVIVLKNLISEAENRLIAEFGKRDIASLLEKLSAVSDEIDINYNLDSLHIFLSNNSKEVVQSPWPIANNVVEISDGFNMKSLVKEYTQTEDYLILLLSQSGVHLYDAVNDSIVAEVRNDDFPFKENGHYHTDQTKLSKPNAMDDMVREFLNKVDKAAVRAHNEMGQNIVVICTEDNYSRLMQVADRPSVYLGHSRVNYNDVALHTLATQAFEVIAEIQKQRRAEAIEEVKEAVGHGKVVTDLSEIYRAVKEGRGELLVARPDFRQAVMMNGENSFDLIEDVTAPGAVDDIMGEITWEVFNKKGRTVFTYQEELQEFGDVALKLRY